MKRLILSSLAAGVAATLAWRVHAQVTVSPADSAFLVQAAQNGQAELMSSRAALEKSSNTQVKAFAQRMIEDHREIAASLSALASAKGIKVPEEPSAAQKGDINQLTTSDAFHFDPRFADAMGVQAHEETIALFRKAATHAGDPEIKAFAAKQLPLLQMHLQMAKTLKAATDAVRPPGE
jgi:putative membrane protein